jgi:hypothetical protein
LGQSSATLASFAGSLQASRQAYGSNIGWTFSRNGQRGKHNNSDGTHNVLKTRVADLADLSDRWDKQPQIPDKELPHPKTDLRITPRP